jgi:hypothetical protein
MKSPSRDSVSRLEELPYIEKTIAADLPLIGINHPGTLIWRAPFAMYDEFSG